jgi:hypothetical protein
MFILVTVMVIGCGKGVNCGCFWLLLMPLFEGFKAKLGCASLMGEHGARPSLSW